MTVKTLQKIALNRKNLIDFEDRIAKKFNDANIKAPVHLSDGNEDFLINFFKEKNIGHDDWVLGSWRSHYHCLLKGVPESELESAIMRGKSISLCFKEYNILCSAIVTGVLPIGVGIAMNLKLQNKKGCVYVFMGDMTAETGVAHECIKYSISHKLPIHFVIEDNAKSVCTDTRSAWHLSKLSFENKQNDYITYYKYLFDKYPHAGAGKRVQF